MKTFMSSSLRTTGCIQCNFRASFHISRSRRWRAESRRRAHAARRAKMEEAPDYKAWSHENLVQRVAQLEQELKQKYSSFKEITRTRTRARPERVFDSSKYSTRLIALKLAYLGKNYNGFEYTNTTTPLPTIEEELWKALDKSKLILPQNIHPLQQREVNWEGCEYSKCGRTDKGVSAFGQVIGIRVRSNRPLGKGKRKDCGSTYVNGNIASQGSKGMDPHESELGIASLALSPSRGVGKETHQLDINDGDYEDDLSFDPIADEISYPVMLNRLLPPDIRILAWCPAPPLDFSARFSCKERQYKYFFTQPAFLPMPQRLEAQSKFDPGKLIRDGWLDIKAMREAAKTYVGLHDFRNFCKVDGSKQLSNFQRRIFHADIVEEDTTSMLGFVNGTSFLPEGDHSLRYPRVYSFTLHGSAFLWHQVRHMVAVLFLVGQGLEPPSIVSELLDAEKNPRRPMYEMASDTPLVLWNCIFPLEGDEERKDALHWIYVGDEPSRGDNKFGSQRGLMGDVWKLWRERKIDEVLAGTLVDVVASQGEDVETLTSTHKRGLKNQMVFAGGNVARLQGTYIPVMEKPLMDSTETINERYAVRKGFRSSEELKELGFRRQNKPSGTVDDDNDE